MPEQFSRLLCKYSHVKEVRLYHECYHYMYSRNITLPMIVCPENMLSRLKELQLSGTKQDIFRLANKQDKTRLKLHGTRILCNTKVSGNTQAFNMSRG